MTNLVGQRWEDEASMPPAQATQMTRLANHFPDKAETAAAVSAYTGILQQKSCLSCISMFESPYPKNPYCNSPNPYVKVASVSLAKTVAPGSQPGAVSCHPLPTGGSKNNA